MSLYFHSINDINSYYHFIKNFPREEAFLTCMKTVHPANSVPDIHYYSQWLKGWLKRVKENPANTLLIRYEEMHKDIEKVLSRVYEFYDYDITEEGIQKVIQKQVNKHKDDKKRSLKENFRKKGSLMSTFRSGETNQWKEFYNENEISFVKENAAEILIESGYEKNNSW